jgi:hypothetical protein
MSEKEVKQDSQINLIIATLQRQRNESMDKEVMLLAEKAALIKEVENLTNKIQKNESKVSKTNIGK